MSPSSLRMDDALRAMRVRVARWHESQGMWLVRLPRCELHVRSADLTLSDRAYERDAALPSLTGANHLCGRGRFFFDACDFSLAARRS